MERERWLADTQKSTLPNRYNRIKINMLRLEDGDVVHLFAAKKEVEDTNAAAFWGNVAANMERRGSSKKYPTAFLQKTVRELELQGEEAAADGKDGGAKGGNGGEGMKEVDTDGSG